MSKRSEFVVEHVPSHMMLTKTYGRWTCDVEDAVKFASRVKARDFMNILYGEAHVADLIVRELHA